MSNLGENLKALRLNKQWSQNRLSKESKVSRVVIANLETGRGNPTRLTISKLCTALGATPEQLYGDDVPKFENNLSVEGENLRAVKDEIKEVQREMLRGFARLEALIGLKK